MKSKGHYFVAVIFFFFLGHFQTTAQSTWAPLGAEWYFHWIEFQGSLDIGYNQYKVEKDTTVLDQPCRWVSSLFKRPNGDEIEGGFFTYTENDSVFFYGEWLPDFQLIMDYSAEVGDTLMLQGVYDLSYYYEPARQVVDSISMENVGGVTLKKWHLTHLDLRCGIATSYYEKIGNFSGIFPEEYCAVFYDSFTDLRCYEDDSISIKLIENCELFQMPDATSEIEELNLQVFPNPGQQTLYLKWDMEARLESYLLLNQYGAVFQQGSLNGVAFEISIHALPAGVYYLQVIDAKGQRSARRFIKS